MLLGRCEPVASGSQANAMTSPGGRPPHPTFFGVRIDEASPTLDERLKATILAGDPASRRSMLAHCRRALGTAKSSRERDRWNEVIAFIVEMNAK